MSGQAGGRGYLIQAVIAVLDALDDREWLECALEPNLGADKIDLLLRSASGDRVSQIKSSENVIGAADVRRWAEELEAAYPGAKQYELRLVGPVTGGAASATRVGNVDVPVPQALNIGALLEQCAHRLDRYLRDLGQGPTRPLAREVLAQALATRLGQLASSGQALYREDLQKLLADWITELLPADASDGTEIPHQLPGPPDDFVGRADELNALKNAAGRDDVRVILIRGLTGVGKSALAASVAEVIENQYPQGQVYLDLRGADLNPRQQTRALAEVIQAFRPTYPGSDDPARCLADFRTLLYGRRVLMLAENVDSAEQVRGLIPPTAGSLLIVTTQSRFDLPGAVPLDLDVLSDEDAVKLVQLIAPRVTSVAPLLAEVCDYLPLAIRIACGTLNARPDLSAEEYMHRLTEVSERASLVRAALDLSLAHAPAEIRRFLAATSVFSTDFDAAGLAAVSAQPHNALDAQVGIAIGRHLIEWDSKRQRYRLHDLIRAYAIDTADALDLSAFRTRHAQYYSGLCSHIEELYRSGGESTFSALNVFDSESENIAAGFYFSAEHAATEESAAEACTAFVRGLTHVMDLRLPPAIRARVLMAGLEAAQKLRNTGLVVLHTGNLGRIYRQLGDLDMALKCHKWVLELATKAGHREDQAYAHHHIGLVLLEKDDFAGGVNHLHEALEFCRDPELDLKTLEANTLSNLGTAYSKTDRPARALDYFRSALNLARELNDPRFLASTMNNLGATLILGKTDPALAVEMLEGAFVIAESLGDRQMQFLVRASLVDALAQSNRSDDAIVLAQSQYEEAASIGYTKFEVDALRGIGELHLAKGDTTAAQALFEKMLQIARNRSDDYAKGKALGAMAELALHKGDRGLAIKLLEERLSLVHEPRDRARVAWNLGHLLAAEGNRDRAVALMRQAMEYFESIGHEAIDAMRERIRGVERGEDGRG